MTKFDCLFAIICEILGTMCIANVFKPGYDVMDFEVNLVFIIKLFFLHDRKFLTKT